MRSICNLFHTFLHCTTKTIHLLNLQERTLVPYRFSRLSNAHQTFSFSCSSRNEMVVNARWTMARAFSISVACKIHITYLTNYIENHSHPTWRFTTTFTKCHHMVLPNARPVQSTSAQPYSNIHINIIILPSVPSPLHGASPKVCKNSYLPHTIHVPSSQYPWFGSYNIITWRRRSINLPIM